MIVGSALVTVGVTGMLGVAVALGVAVGVGIGGFILVGAANSTSFATRLPCSFTPTMNTRSPLATPLTFVAIRPGAAMVPPVMAASPVLLPATLMNFVPLDTSQTC